MRTVRVAFKLNYYSAYSYVSQCKTNDVCYVEMN